eukprot:363348-Chlamydomonas_euryale.AAC.7
MCCAICTQAVPASKAAVKKAAVSDDSSEEDSDDSDSSEEEEEAKPAAKKAKVRVHLCFACASPRHVATSFPI